MILQSGFIYDTYVTPFVIILILFLCFYFIYNIILFIKTDFMRSNLLIDNILNIIISVPLFLLLILTIIGLFASLDYFAYLTIVVFLLLIPLYLFKIVRDNTKKTYNNSIDLRKLSNYFGVTMLNLIINCTLYVVAVYLYNR